MKDYYPSKRVLLTVAEQWLLKADITPFKSSVKFFYRQTRGNFNK